MKMTNTHITILAYFLNDTLNCKELCGKEKYLLNSLYEKLNNNDAVTLFCCNRATLLNYSKKQQ